MKSYRANPSDVVGALEYPGPLIHLAGLLAYAGLTVAEIAGASSLGWLTWAPTPPIPDVSRRLTTEEARALLGEVTLSGDASDELLIYLLMVCGLRQIEARRLRWCDVETFDQAAELCVMGKGGKVRYVPVGPRGRELLTSVRASTGASTDDSTAVFTNRGGAPLSRNGMRRRVNIFLHAAAPGRTPHALRHTSISIMLEEGGRLETTMEVSGHSTPESHAVYAAAAGGWFYQQWFDFHPLARVLEQGRVLHPCAAVHVPGEPMKDQMKTGVERVVPLPLTLVTAVSTALRSEGPPWWPTPRDLTLEACSKLPWSLTDIRSMGAAHFLEAGGHPYMVSLLHGTTLEHVVDMKYERRGPRAIAEREAAVVSAERVVYG